MIATLSRRLVGAVLSIILVVPALIDAGCASHKADDLGQAITTLSSSGVGIYSSFGAPAPLQAVGGAKRSALRLTQWQLGNMLTQARAGMGLRGRDLDAMEGPKAPAKAPTISFIIAAWLVRGHTDLSTYAAQFMPKKPDYKHAPKLLFPRLVVALFIADIARLPGGQPAARQTGLNFEHLIAAPAAADVLSNPCSTVLNFVDGVIADITHALQIQDTDSLLGTLYNIAVSTIIQIAVAAVQKLLAPVLTIIKSVIAVISMVTLIVSAIQKWTVSVQEDPVSITMDQEQHQGTLTATLDASDNPWPSQLTDCAKALAGIDLDNINYKGAPVHWTPYGDVPKYAHVVNKQEVISDDKTAVLTYETEIDPKMPERSCSAETLVGYVGAQVMVERSDAKAVMEKLQEAVYAQLPKAVQTFLIPVLQPYIDQGRNALQNFISAPAYGDGYAQLAVWERDPRLCKPLAKPTPKPTPANDNKKITGAWNCNTHKSISTAIGPIDIEVQAKLKFFNNGTATGETPTSSHLQGGVQHVVAGDAWLAGGLVPYRFNSTSSNAGVLTTAGRTSPVQLLGPNAMVITFTSPNDGNKASFHCDRTSH